MPFTAASFLALVASRFAVLAGSFAVPLLGDLAVGTLALARRVAEFRVLRSLPLGLPSLRQTEPRHLGIRPREERTNDQEEDDERGSEAEPPGRERPGHLRLSLLQVAPQAEQTGGDEEPEAAAHVDGHL